MLRINTISTHAFIVLEGSLRLLALEPNHNELFTVGRAEPGDTAFSRNHVERSQDDPKYIILLSR